MKFGVTVHHRYVCAPCIRFCVYVSSQKHVNDVKLRATNLEYTGSIRK